MKRKMKVHILEISNVGKCYHYQAVFDSFELAQQARRKYLSDPSIKKMMIASITSIEVHTNLAILDSVKPLKEE